MQKGDVLPRTINRVSFPMGAGEYTRYSFSYALWMMQRIQKYLQTMSASDRSAVAGWFNIDLWSVIYGCKIFTPMLKRQGGGYIINTASSAGTLAGPEMACYNVAKAGVVSLSETLNAELSKDNIGVSVICPTVFVTSLGDSLTGGRPMEQSLIRQLESSKVSASDITDDVISAIEKNRLYVISQTDARWGWRMKRMFPESFARTISYLYRNKKWIYSD